jgi:hypothetical protein
MGELTDCTSDFWYQVNTIIVAIRVQSIVTIVVGPSALSLGSQRVVVVVVVASNITVQNGV